MRRSRLEILVGLFVILALVILAFMVFFISGVYVFKQGYHLNVLFNFVSHLEKGASVHLAGIPVGSVSDLQIQYDEKKGNPVVRTELFIDKGVKIPENARIRIEGIYGLMTPYLEIRAGDSPSVRVLKDGETVTGVDPVPMDDLVARGQQIVDNLQETVVRINNFSKDPEVTKSMRQTIINLDSLTTTLNEILKNKQGDLANTLSELEDSMGHLRNILQKIDKGEGTIGKLVSDEALYKEIEDFVKDLKKHPWKLLKKGEETDKKRKFGIF